MKEQGSQTTLSNDSLTVEIVNVLDSHGIGHDTYTLHDYIDVEALEKILASADPNLTVQLTIEGIPMSITRDGVHVLNQA